MTDSRLIDSSVWLAYLFNGVYEDIIDKEEILLLSVLSLFEIKRKLMKSSIDKQIIAKSIDFIKRKSLLISVNEEIAENAADLSHKHNLPAADAIIYSTSSLNNAALITLDSDFRGLGDVVILK